jgi:hypothetical protein
MLSIDPTGSWRIAPDGREVAMTSLSLTSGVRADGIYLFDSGKEVGLIKRENGQWIIYLFDRPSPITFGSLQAAQYHALACYIETVWRGPLHSNEENRKNDCGVTTAQKR